MVVLSVDPGLRQCGVALFIDGALRAAGLPPGELATTMHNPRERAEIFRTMAGEVNGWALAQLRLRGLPAKLDHLAIEFPRVRDRRTQRAAKKGTDPNDLVDLAGIVGAILASVDAPATVWLPEEWKGQVPKEIHNARAIARLSPAELANVPKRPRAKDFDHNIVDAIGIGLHYAGRL